MIQILQEDVLIMFNQLMERFDVIEKKLEQLSKTKQCFNGDTLLDNQDLCMLLGVSKRTLIRYHTKKLVRYYRIDGRTYYKASELDGFLKAMGKAKG